MKGLFTRTGNKTKGQALLEYALLVVLLAVAVIMALQVLGVRLFNVFGPVSNVMGIT